jgi:hypothetical protein
LSQHGAEVGSSRRATAEAGPSHRYTQAPPSRGAAARHLTNASPPLSGTESGRPRRAAAVSADEATRKVALIESRIDPDEGGPSLSRLSGTAAALNAGSSAPPVSARAPAPKQKNKSSSGAWALPNNVKPDFTLDMWARIGKMARGTQITDSDFWSFLEAHGLPKKPLYFTVRFIFTKIFNCLIKVLNQTPCANCDKAEHPCIFRGKSACLRCQIRKQACQGGTRPQVGKGHCPQINRRIELLDELKRMGRYNWPSHFLDEKGMKSSF